jgi:hypothetical protein
VGGNTGKEEPWCGGSDPKKSFSPNPAQPAADVIDDLLRESPYTHTHTSWAHAPLAADVFRKWTPSLIV